MQQTWSIRKPVCGIRGKLLTAWRSFWFGVALILGIASLLTVDTYPASLFLSYSALSALYAIVAWGLLTITTALPDSKTAAWRRWNAVVTVVHEILCTGAAVMLFGVSALLISGYVVFDLNKPTIVLGTSVLGHWFLPVAAFVDFLLTERRVHPWAGLVEGLVVLAGYGAVVAIFWGATGEWLYSVFDPDSGPLANALAYLVPAAMWVVFHFIAYGIARHRERLYSCHAPYARLVEEGARRDGSRVATRRPISLNGET